MNRIKELRIQRGMTQKDLAKLLNCAPTAVSKYELEQLGLDADLIRELCGIFHCSADYLLGLSILPASDLTEEEASLLLAWRASDSHIKQGIRALLAPYLEDAAGAVS